MAMPFTPMLGQALGGMAAGMAAQPQVEAPLQTRPAIGPIVAPSFQPTLPQRQLAPTGGRAPFLQRLGARANLMASQGIEAYQGADKQALANTGLGLVGLAKMFSANRRQPRLAAPGQISSVLPSHNYAAMRSQGHADNAAASAGAVGGLRNAAGADINAYTMGLQSIISGRLRANDAVNGRVDELQHRDRTARAEQQSQDMRDNFQTQRSHQEAMYQQQLAQRSGQRAEGMAMVQGAVDYGMQKRASDARYGERLKEQQGKMHEVGYSEELRTAAGIADPAQRAAETKRINEHYQGLYASPGRFTPRPR